MTPAMRIDPTLMGFLALYERKMLNDFQSGLPFVRYEDFIIDSEKYLRKIVNHMELEWHENVMKSHELYKEGDIGHGGIKLWRTVHAQSDAKYKKLSPATKSIVYSLTHETLRAFGYAWDGEEVTVQDGIDGML